MRSSYGAPDLAWGIQLRLVVACEDITEVKTSRSQPAPPHREAAPCWQDEERRRISRELHDAYGRVICSALRSALATLLRSGPAPEADRQGGAGGEPSIDRTKPAGNPYSFVSAASADARRCGTAGGVTMALRRLSRSGQTSASDLQIVLGNRPAAGGTPRRRCSASRRRPWPMSTVTREASAYGSCCAWTRRRREARRLC